MIKTIEVETDDNFESCDDCIHHDDETVICMARGCIHAIPRGYIAESREVSQALNEFADKLEEIEKKYADNTESEHYTK